MAAEIILGVSAAVVLAWGAMMAWVLWQWRTKE